MATQSIEVCEAENPVEILAYEFVPDRAGAGKFRGGAPYRRDYKLLESEAVLQVRSDRKVFRPYGLYGGNPGASSRNIMNPATDARPLDSKLTMTMYSGEVLRHELAGGGGWGDPLDRDPEKVLQDIRNELVSIESARNDYGVIIQPIGWRVDLNATEKLRSDIRKLRIGKTPVVLWEDWSRKDITGVNL
jgi:N-methylhydantoinase B